MKTDEIALSKKEVYQGRLSAKDFFMRFGRSIQMRSRFAMVLLFLNRERVWERAWFKDLITRYRYIRRLGKSNRSQDIA